MSQRVSSSGHDDGPGWPPELNGDQVLMLQAVWDAFSTEDFEWPVFDHLSSVAESHGFDAYYTIESLPAACTPMYGLVWHERHGPPQPGTPIALTIAGMAVVEGADWLLAYFFELITTAARLWRSLPSRPSEPRKLRIAYSDLVSILNAKPIRVDVVKAVQSVLLHEPATWSGVTRGDFESWEWNVPPSIVRFEGTNSMPDYLQGVSDILAPSKTNDLNREEFVAQIQPPVTIVEDALTKRIEAAWVAEEWDQVARQALVFLEDRFRQLTKRKSGSSSTQVVKEVLHPSGGLYPLAAEDYGESEGWHLLTLGLFKAVRNPVGHRLDMIQSSEEAEVIVGLVRLLIGRLSREYPSLGEDMQGATDTD